MPCVVKHKKVNRTPVTPKMKGLFLHVYLEVSLAVWINDPFLSRVCVSNTNPSGISWWERLWADGGHEHSEEGQEDPWLSDLPDSLRSDCLHRHYWEYQVEYCLKSVMNFLKIDHFSPFLHFVWPTCLYSVILLHPDTREIFPEGLPPSYVFVATLRLKGSSSKVTFDLWRVLSKDKEIQAAVTLSGKDKTVILTTTSMTEKEQRVIFKAGFQVGIRIEFHVHTRSIRDKFLTWLLGFWRLLFFQYVKIPDISLSAGAKHYCSFASDTAVKATLVRLLHHFRFSFVGQPCLLHRCLGDSQLTLSEHHQ